jgi:hypothetical protein
MSKRRLLIILGIVAVVVVLVIVFDMTLANHRPVITHLEALERVVPNGKCEIMCIASDRDGDPLSYNWSASGGSISGTGAAVNWTAPDSLGSYNVTVTVTDGRGSEVMKQVTIEVRANESPAITSLVADVDWTLPSGTLQMTCTASDPDGDELTYEWTASAGDISGTGEAVNWTAPQEVGIHNVTVVVKDGHGSSAASLLHISVATEQPPTIEALLVTADHCYLRTNVSPYWVGQGKQYHIGCVVSNTSSELSYEWSRTGGELSGEGLQVTWTAPNSTGKVTITVTVSDIAGHMSIKDLLLDVRSCTGCSFPGCSA